MVKRLDASCFELFHSLNCTVRPQIFSSLSGSSSKLSDIQSCSSMDSPSKSVKDDVDCVANFDTDKMMAHILDCLSALVRVDELQADAPDKTQIAQVKRRVFRKAVELVMKSSTTEGRKPDLERILQSFPDATKLQDDRKWLSLHWAVLEDAAMEEDDIEAVYSADPMALSRHHLKNLNDNFCQGYTPSHLISFQKNPRMSIVRFLDIHSPRAFLFSSRGLTEKKCRYPVQLAAAHTGSLDFLQFLLQIHVGAPRLGLGYYSTPLCELIKRENYNCAFFPVVLQCLLAIDSSADVVDEAIRCLILKLGGKQEKSEVLLNIFGQLLKANSGAAFIVDSQRRILLHYASKYLKDIPCACTIIEALLLVNIEGASVIDVDECYPITTAAQYSTVEVVKLLFAAHPDAALVDDEHPRRNLLHNGIYNTVDPNMMPYLCHSFPKALQGFSQDRKMPIHELCYQQVENRYRSLITMCKIDSSIASKGCGAGSNRLGIPLHLLIIGEAKADLKNTTSDAANCFRHLLMLYPESASIRDVDGNTSYTLAVILHMKPYFIRLLLRADITIDPAVLRGLNYRERRGAMFLAFSAVTSNKRPSLLALIRKANMHILEIVFSYL